MTKKLQITRALNGISLCGDELWLEDDGTKCGHKSTVRIGIDYAAPHDREKLWRFVII